MKFKFINILFYILFIICTIVIIINLKGFKSYIFNNKNFEEIYKDHHYFDKNYNYKEYGKEYFFVKKNLLFLNKKSYKIIDYSIISPYADENLGEINDWDISRFSDYEITKYKKYFNWGVQKEKFIVEGKIFNKNIFIYTFYFIFKFKDIDNPIRIKKTMTIYKFFDLPFINYLIDNPLIIIKERDKERDIKNKFYYKYKDKNKYFINYPFKYPGNILLINELLDKYSYKNIEYIISRIFKSVIIRIIYDKGYKIEEKNICLYDSIYKY